MYARAVSAFGPLALAAIALLGLLSSPLVAQQDGIGLPLKVPFDKKIKYEIPVGLSCPHHLSAFSDDTSIFDVSFSNGFTMNPKITIHAKGTGVATLFYTLIGKDEFEGDKGDCTGSTMGSMSVRVLPDEKTIDQLVKELIGDLKTNLAQEYKTNGKGFDSSIKDLYKDFKDGSLSLDAALSLLNSGYLNATFSNLLDTRSGLADLSSDISGVLVQFDSEPGLVGGHSQQGAWGRWDQGLYDVTGKQEDAAKNLDSAIWKVWKKFSKSFDDPELVPEFTLVRKPYNYFGFFGLVPPNADDWSAKPPRLAASIYYMMGYAKECDPLSGALWIAGYAEPDTSMHGELTIGEEYFDEFDFTTELDGTFSIGLGTFGSYGHGDGEVSDPLPSGLARYDLFYEGDEDPMDSMFITIP